MSSGVGKVTFKVFLFLFRISIDKYHLNFDLTACVSLYGAHIIIIIWPSDIMTIRFSGMVPFKSTSQDDI